MRLPLLSTVRGTALTNRRVRKDGQSTKETDKTESDKEAEQEANH